MKATEIHQYQKDLHEQPRIWWVRIEGEYDEPCDFYDSREGAELEAEWRNKHRIGVGNLCHVVGAPIHNLDLSQRRWGKCETKS